MKEKILLEIQTSVRQQGSISRRLSRQFINEWCSYHHNIKHIIRDVGINPPAHPTELWTKANYTLPEERSSEMEDALIPSEELIQELLAADYIVLAIPIYNCGVPSNFKAYIDNIVRINRTFKVDRSTLDFHGLAKGKKVLIINPSAANYSPGTAMSEMDFCEPYVRAIFNFIGITEIECVKVPDQFMPEEIRNKAIENTSTQLIELAKNW